MQSSPKYKNQGGSYDGARYARIVDPLLAGLRGFLAARIPEGGRHLDVCCGTGALAFHLSERCDQVVGIDHSPAMIAYALVRRERSGVKNLEFSAADASRLTDYGDRCFDSASVVMAVHEMPQAIRLGVLGEVLRVAREAFLVDFRIPMPWNLSGFRNRFLEMTAGRRHFSNFRDYSRRGGLPVLLDQVGACVAAERDLDRGSMQFFHVEALEQQV